jgi:hypothetical protein
VPGPRRHLWWAQVGAARSGLQGQARVEAQRRLCRRAQILAGATNRSVLDQSKVGIHRPFWTSNAPLSQDDATRKYRALEALTRAYLHEMNIPVSLFDAMARVPADDVHMLTMDELAQFGLRGMDPVEAEMRDADFARTLGVTRVEYLARKRRTEQLCMKPDWSLMSLPDDKAMQYFKLPKKLEDQITAQTACYWRVLQTGR